MTLRELRKSKGLTQKEAAELLSMSTRNYQIYETNEKGKISSLQYQRIYKTLENLQETLPIRKNEFHLNIKSSNDLEKLTESVKDYQKRDCFSSVMEFLNGSQTGKVMILYGLRRTGKTTILFQAIRELPLKECCYIKIQSKDNMKDLVQDLEILSHIGIRYVFIDEITLMDDFISTAGILSDIYSMLPMKIILSGTDSLGFSFACQNELYDRAINIHTSYIPFREYERLLGIHDLDIYIDYGGTLRKENIDFSDSDYKKEEIAFYDDESTRKYIDTAISQNIQHALKTDQNSHHLAKIKELYEQNELTNVINRIVEDMNHDFLLSVIDRRFKSHDLGSSKNLLLHEAPQRKAYALYDIDTEEVLHRMKDILEIKEKNERKINVDETVLLQIKEYLFQLDLIAKAEIRYDKGNPEERYLFLQPGMRYSICKALVYSLMKDSYFQSLSIEERTDIQNKIMSDVKGRMLEDIILYETKSSLGPSYEIFQYRFLSGGEFDMVVSDTEKLVSYLFEIKHSNKIVKNQVKNLNDLQKTEIVQYRYGKIQKKYILYKGNNDKADDIDYVNIEDYLRDVRKYIQCS